MEAKINELFDLHVPLVIKEVNHYINQRMTPEILRLRKERDSAYILVTSEIFSPPSLTTSPFYFNNVCPADVVFAIRSMKSNAAGLDGVSLKFGKPSILLFIIFSSKSFYEAS
ncbi:hypothetical protein ACFFRR_004219 [Megaselia abdita]